MRMERQADGSDVFRYVAMLPDSVKVQDLDLTGSQYYFYEFHKTLGEEDPLGRIDGRLYRLRSTDTKTLAEVQAKNWNLYAEQSFSVNDTTVRLDAFYPELNKKLKEMNVSSIGIQIGSGSGSVYGTLPHPDPDPTLSLIHI